jgi:hypothetical protein
MFNQSIDDRLSSWAQHRAQLNNSTSPFEDIWAFWKQAPYIPYNNKIDPYHKASWPSPWEIIVDNKYDDFTKAVMIAWTLKLTDRFNKSVIVVKTYVDKSKSRQYNVVCVDDTWAINYSDNGPVPIENIPDSFLLENLVELEPAR